MATVDHHSHRRRFRLAHLGQPVGARSHDSLLRTVRSRSTKRGAGLADGPSVHDRALLRRFPGVLARWLRHPQRMQLRQRRGRDSTMDIHPIRTPRLSRFQSIRRSLHIHLRVALCGAVVVGLSACAQLQTALEVAAGQNPAPARTVIVPARIQYQPQPRLGSSWQGNVGKRGLARVIAQKNPAIVNTPAPWPYIPNLARIHQETLPYTPAGTQKETFHIPASWFKNGAKNPSLKITHQNLLAGRNPLAGGNPWHCTPAKLPCGKNGTDYWACSKTAGTVTDLAGKGEKCKP